MCSSVQNRDTRRQNMENKKLLCDCYVFKSEKDMRKSLSRLCYGNLYVAGSVCVEALKSALLGNKMSLVPTVNASEPCPKPEDKPPEKPKPMKFTDLPLDKSPHYEYNTYEYEKVKCCGYKRKLLEEVLLPHVQAYRADAQKNIAEYSSCLKQTFNEVVDIIDLTQRQIKEVCRDDNNLCHRQIALGSAAALGFFLTSRRQLLWVRKLLGAGVAATLVGALCFPKETDEAIREVSYHTAKGLIACYNFYSRDKAALKERLPCPAAFPPEPKPRPDKCCEEKAKKQAEFDKLKRPKTDEKTDDANQKL